MQRFVASIDALELARINIANLFRCVLAGLLCATPKWLDSWWRRRTMYVDRARAVPHAVVRGDASSCTCGLGVFALMLGRSAEGVPTAVEGPCFAQRWQQQLGRGCMGRSGGAGLEAARCERVREREIVLQGGGGSASRPRVVRYAGKSSLRSEACANFQDAGRSLPQSVGPTFRSTSLQLLSHPGQVWQNLRHILSTLSQMTRPKLVYIS